MSLQEVGVPQEAQIPGRMPSRRRRVIVAAIASLFFVSVAGAVVVAVTYNPLRFGNFGGTPSNTLPYRDVREDSVQVRTFTYEHEAAFSVGLSVRNRGRWGITVLSVSSRDFGLFHVTSAERGVEGKCCASFEPFRPFALHPGEFRPIVLHGVLRGCADYAGGWATTWNTYRIKYRVLGVTREATIEDQYDKISIEIPADYSCPEPASR